MPILGPRRLTLKIFELNVSTAIDNITQYFHITERSIQRDLGALRCFLDEQDTGQEIVCDQASHRYHIQDASSQTLSNSEILAVCKILLESRSMRKDELFPILDKLIFRCVPDKNRRVVQYLIANEKHHYIAGAVNIAATGGAVLAVEGGIPRRSFHNKELPFFCQCPQEKHFSRANRRIIRNRAIVARFRTIPNNGQE